MPSLCLDDFEIRCITVVVTATLFRTCSREYFNKLLMLIKVIKLNLLVQIRDQIILKFVPHFHVVNYCRFHALFTVPLRKSVFSSIHLQIL